MTIAAMAAVVNGVHVTNYGRVVWAINSMDGTSCSMKSCLGCLVRVHRVVRLEPARLGFRVDILP